MDKTHVQHKENQPLAQKVRDCIKGQDHMRSKGTAYLPMTAGMIARGEAGKAQYEAYKKRARFENLVQDTENGIIGLAFKKPADEDLIYETVTRNGRDATSLAKSQVREVLETGRGVMVVDAPQQGGEPYIVEYPAESLLDWAVDDQDTSKLVAAKLQEQYFEPDDIYKESPKDQFREYRLIDGVVQVRVTDDSGTPKEEYSIPLGYLPIFTPGSVDNLPDWDAIPLLPVAECAIAMYQISADYRQFVYGHGQGTPWGTGITVEEADSILQKGLGVGAFLFSTEDNAKFGMLESSGGTASTFTDAIEAERKKAEKYAVQISQESGGVEAAESMKLRAGTQHATVYTVLDSVSDGIEAAIRCMMEWSGRSGEPKYRINTEFSSHEASAQLVTALSGAINAEIIPKSVLRNVLRSAGHTDLTDEEMDAEIYDGGGAAYHESEI